MVVGEFEKMNIKILDRLNNENNREYAYRLLRYNIMSLQLLPGASINEGELSELLNVSRTPIREAILMLKDEDLIEVYPQSGSKVSLIDMAIVKEGYFLRAVIETEIIMSLAGNMNKEQLSELKENLEQQQRIIDFEERDKIDAFVRTDDEFHHKIYELASKHKIWYSVKKICSHYDRVRYLDAIINSIDLNDILKQHNKIYYLLLIGYDADFDFKLFYDRHLGIYKRSFKEIMEKYPTYFKV